MTDNTRRKLVRNAVEWLLEREDTLSGGAIHARWVELSPPFEITDHLVPQTYTPLNLHSDIVVGGNILHLCAVIAIGQSFDPWMELVSMVSKRIERESPFYKGLLLGAEGTKMETRGATTGEIGLLQAGHKIGKNSIVWQAERRKMDQEFGSTP